MSTARFLSDRFRDRFAAPRLDPAGVLRLRRYFDERTGRIDAAGEGYEHHERQRDLTVRYVWGHNHPVDDAFTIPGRMGDRHITVLARFIDSFGLDRDLTGLRVLDLGAWTGGMSLMLTALGAQVVALEEVRKYAETVNFLAELFELQNQLVCLPESLYDYLPRVADRFHVVICSGVIYHVTDPVQALRLMFTALTDGGRCFIETAGLESPDSVCAYEGPDVLRGGSEQERTRGGWNYFVPSPTCLKRWIGTAGFQIVDVGPIDGTRLHACATRTAFDDFLRAGLANRRLR